MNDIFLNSANAPYVAELYFKFFQDPSSVDKSWSDFFNSLNDDDLSVIKDFRGPEWKNRPSNTRALMFWNHSVLSVHFADVQSVVLIYTAIR